MRVDVVAVERRLEALNAELLEVERAHALLEEAEALERRLKQRKDELALRLKTAAIARSQSGQP